MTKGIRWSCLLLLLGATCALADDQIRQAQEQLRRRNLYFGDVDGRTSADLSNAIKRYQARKGFTATGKIDQLTATSLNILTEGPSSERMNWPDMPVLKSDTARDLPEPRRQQIAQLAEENLDVPTPSPAPPAEEPPASQDVSPAQVNQLVEQYLRDGESSDVAAQARYFSYPVAYFDHGEVGPAFVEKDVANYCNRWPERKYSLTEPVTFAASDREGETLVEFPITFTVRNKKHSVTGRTRNFWRLRSEGDELKIVAVREERLRN